ncbi:MAG: hypothetical protein O7G88_08800 [bacterium]|nr:hypothetical protein [bacterium]
MGSDVHLFLLARGHQRGDGELWPGDGAGRRVANFEMSKTISKRSGRPVIWLSIAHRWSEPNARRRAALVAEIKRHSLHYR